MANKTLPEGWEWKSVGDVVTFEYGKGLTQGKRDTTGKIPVYGSNGIVGYHSSALIDKPCLIIGRKGAAGAVHKSDVPCWPIDTTYYAIPPETINLTFLYHLFSSLDFPSLDRSTAIPGLNRNDAYAVEIPLPPRPEQERIVTIMEELFSDLDAGVAALERVRAGLKRYKASVLKAAVSGKLLNGKLGIGEDELPEGWRWAKVEDLAKVGTGATPLRSKAKYWAGGSIPWITSGALNELIVYEANEFITDIAIKETNAKMFPSGTLLVAMYGEGKTRGKVSELMIEAATNQACAALVFSKEMIGHKPYVKLFFEKNYEDIRRLSSGGVQPNLNLSIIKNTRVPIPPLDEQRRIVAEVERRLSVVGEVEDAVEAGLARAARLRQSVLRSAFEGRLV